MELVIKKFNELTVEELHEILKLRVSVFVVEQNCPYQEVDDKDRYSYHVYLKDEEGIQAYLRVIEKTGDTDEVAIGRVIAVKRRCGLGTEILKEGVKVARDYLKADKVVLEAQTYARKLYEKVGFEQISEEFLEDGIPHIKMMMKF